MSETLGRGDAADGTPEAGSASGLVHPPSTAPAAVAALLDAVGFGAAPPCLAVSARDEMFQFALSEHHGSSRERAQAAYFRSGASAYRLLDGLLRWHSPLPAAQPPRILDFASGYGRVTRFLKAAYPDADITACEIDPDAVAFQRRWLGVEGEVSTTDPTDLGAEGPWDLIFVASLFSHLPEVTFEAWLGALYRRLAPGGLLAFSVHDEAVMLPGRTLPESGFYFEAMSESEFLDTAEYGSAWVSADYVHGAIQRVARQVAEERGAESAPPAVVRVPQGLWHLQDLYVVCPEGGPAVQERLDGLPLGRGVEGYLDRFRWHEDGSLSLGGWAADHDRRGFPQGLRLSVDDRTPGEWETGLLREDVSTFLRDEAFARSGFSLHMPASITVSPDHVVTLTADGLQGTEVLFAGTVEGAVQGISRDNDAVRQRHQEQRLALLEAELQACRGRTAGLEQRADDLQRRYEDLGWHHHVLEERLRGMESSFFWKLRNRWFALKGALGG